MAQAILPCAELQWSWSSSLVQLRQYLLCSGVPNLRRHARLPLRNSLRLRNTILREKTLRQYIAQHRRALRLRDLGSVVRAKLIVAARVQNRRVADACG